MIGQGSQMTSQSIYSIDEALACLSEGEIKPLMMKTPHT